MGLLQYIGSRVGAYLVVLFIGVTITFFLPRMLPADPIEGYIMQIQTQAGRTLDPVTLQQLRDRLGELYGLKGDLLTQYLTHLKRVFLTFDFGPSLSSYPKPVSEIILTALPWTLGLLITTTIIAWTIGNLVGLLAGFFHNNGGATVLEVLGVVLYPIPYYIMALVLILLFAYIWPIFPLSTTIRPGPFSLEKLGNIISNSFLPGMTLVLAGFGWNILGMKSLAFATKEEAYVTFARLKGVRPWTIMTRYVFRNALLPQVTALALSIGTIFSGALLTEVLFSYPGLGLIMRTAIGNGDYNVLYGTITISILAVASAALIIDLLYPLLDPRIRYK